MPESPVGRGQNAHPLRCSCKAISCEERLAAERFGSRKKQLGLIRVSYTLDGWGFRRDIQVYGANLYGVSIPALKFV